VLEELLTGITTELESVHHSVYDPSTSTTTTTHPTPATQQYIDLINELIANPNSGVAEILSAMIPCLRLYGFIGCQLYRAVLKDMSEEEFLLHHPYHEWIATYSSPDYLRFPAIAEAALDEVVAVDGCSYGKFFSLPLSLSL
jgi:thiaminase